MRDFLKALKILFVVVGILASVSALFIWWVIYDDQKRFKPYLSYTRLVNLASGINDYKKQNGAWPADITQLENFRLDLRNDITDGYDNAVIMTPYSEIAGCGKVISYGRDGKPGGDNKFDRDIEIRFPTDMETNAQWNKQVGERFKSRADKGL
jgi:hypothetical protein